jgi:transposase
MIALPGNARVRLAAGATDMRKGFDGLAALVQTQLEEDPFGGHLFVFRGRAGDRVKILWWSGDGFCCLLSASSAVASCGRRQLTVQFSSLRRSCRCSWRGSIGDVSSARTIRIWRYKSPCFTGFGARSAEDRLI